MKPIEISKETLINLYVEKTMTSYEIAELLQCNRSTITRKLEKYGIPINPSQRKFYHLKAIPLIQEQRDFLVGTLLGDGWCGKTGRRINAYFSVGHCEEQKDLLFWKKGILGNLVNSVVRKVDKRDNSIMWQFSTLCHQDMNFFAKLFYEKQVKIIRDELIHYLTPFGLAVWIMDDGSLNNGVNLRIHTECFTEEENIKLQYMIKTVFDLRCKVAKFNRNGKVYCFLSFNKENTIKASKIVEPFFDNCKNMQYKLYTSAPQRPYAKLDEEENEAFSQDDIV